MATKAKPNKFTLRGFVDGFVNVLKPDTKYNGKGEYKIAIICDKKDPRVAKAMAAVAAAMPAPLEAFWEANKKKPVSKQFRGELPEQLPYVDLGDGRVAFKFKSIASGVNDKGEAWCRVIPHFDGTNERIEQDKIPRYGEGSEIAVAFIVNGFANVVAGSGASLRLEQIKILNVKQFAGGAASSEFGDEDEGDYVASQEEGFDDDEDLGETEAPARGRSAPAADADVDF